MANSDVIEARLAEDEAYERRVVAGIEHAMANGSFYEAAAAAIDVRLFDHVPPLVYRLWCDGRITREQLPEAIAEVWIQNPSPMASLGQRRWLEMFKAAVAEVRGPLLRTVEVKLLVADASTPVAARYEHLTELPAGPLEVWRGAALGSGCGMSWSAYRGCARSFAESNADLHGRPSGLYRAVVPPHGVLGLFADEREQEVVVNPYVVARSRELVDDVAPSAEAVQRRESLLRTFGIEP